MQVPIRVLRSWAATNQEVATFIAPKPFLPGRSVQFTLWVGTRPWTRLPHWKCPGCGGPSFQRRRFCGKCKKRLEVGLPLDLEDYVTEPEYRALCKRIPGGAFCVGGRPPLEKGRT